MGIELLKDAIQASILQGDRRIEGASRSYLAQILLDAGDLTGSESEARASASLLAAAPPIRVESFAVLAHALLRQGRAKEALAAAESAIAIIDKIGGVERGEILARLAHAEMLRAVNDEQRAREAAALAKQRVLANAETIRDASIRDSFSRVPEVARTLAL